jgi:general secretion pathway protein K
VRVRVQSSRWPRDRGAALVLVLSTVAFMAMIAAAAMEASMMGFRRTQNQAELSQARWYLTGAELFAASRLRALVRDGDGAGIDQADWQARAFTFPLDDGAMTLTLLDGGNCLNLNGLVTLDEGGRETPNPAAQVQLARLIDLVGVRVENAAWLAAALTDWIDADSVVSAGGAEDEAYGGADAPYRVANARLIDLDEVSRVRGFTPDILRALRPYVCVRPGMAAVGMNPNTLRVEDGRILSAVVGPSLPLAAAETLIRARPRGGWTSLDAFFAEPAMMAADLSEGGRLQFSLTSTYFVAMMAVAFKSTRETSAAVLDARADMRVVRRVYGVSGQERGL